MSDLKEKVNIAINRLRNFCPDNDSYYVAYSGGKDSDCIRILCELANVPYELHYNLTTADAPETIQYIKSIGNVSIDKARFPDGKHKTMWNLIPLKQFPPTRKVRYCCSELKEIGGKGRMKVTGVRWSESVNRSNNSGLVNILGKPRKIEKFAEKNDISIQKSDKGGIIMNYDNSDSRRLTEFCYRTTNTMINPIIDWDDWDVWQFLNYYGCKSNPLYQCGFSRVGCIGCPLGGLRSQKFEFSVYPKIRDNYIRSFQKLVEQAPVKKTWTTGEEVFEWWLNIDSNQLTFDGFELYSI